MLSKSHKFTILVRCWLCLNCLQKLGVVINFRIYVTRSYYLKHWDGKRPGMQTLVGICQHHRQWSSWRDRLQNDKVASDLVHKPKKLRIVFAHQLWKSCRTGYQGGVEAGHTRPKAHRASRHHQIRPITPYGPVGQSKVRDNQTMLVVAGHLHDHPKSFWVDSHRGIDEGPTTGQKVCQIVGIISLCLGMKP